MISQWWKSLTSAGEHDQHHLLFVYGTLREGYHWNSKFLSTSTKVCTAITVESFPLVVGQSYVPYLLGDLPGVGHPIVGEVWEVDNVTLQNLDEYLPTIYVLRDFIKRYVTQSDMRALEKDITLGER